jgi:hypothetical protein
MVDSLVLWRLEKPPMIVLSCRTLRNVLWKQYLKFLLLFSSALLKPLYSIILERKLVQEECALVLIHLAAHSCFFLHINSLGSHLSIWHLLTGLYTPGLLFLSVPKWICILHISSGRTPHLVLWVVDFVRDLYLTSSHHFCSLDLNP